MEKTKKELETTSNEISGDIYMGSGQTEAVSVVASVFREITKIHPNIRFHIKSADAISILEKLDKGLIDFALLVEPENIDKYNYICLEQTDTWGVLMRKDSILAQKDKIFAKDLYDKKLIVPSRAILSKKLSTYLKCDIFSLNIVATYDLIYNASRFVKMDIGFAITLDNLIDTSDNSLLCFRPFFPKLESKIFIAWKKDQVFSKAADLFMKMLKNIAVE